jgi:hypothetical protein
MKCRELRAWFLVTHAEDEQPRAIVRHLRRCPRCRRLRRKLVRLERQTAALPVPGDGSAARARLLDTLGRLPLPAAPAAPRASRRRLLLARLVLLILGLLIGYGFARWSADGPGPEHRDTPQVVLPGSVKGGPEVVLVGRLVEHDLELAGASGTAAQLQTLTHMAATLRDEAIRLAAHGPTEQLPLLTRLHESVLRRGVLGRLRSLTPAEREPVLPGLLQDLRDADEALTRAAPELSAPAAHCLEPMGTAVREMLDLVGNIPALPPESEPASLPVGSDDGSPLRSLLAVLVTHGLLLAEEDSPVRRAYFCNDLADQLMLASLAYSLRGDHEQAWQLNQQIEKVVDRGLSANLARIQQQSPQDPRLRDLESIIQRTTRTLEALEKELSLSVRGESRPAPASRYAQTRDLEKELKDLAKSLKELGKDKKEKDKDKDKKKK